MQVSKWGNSLAIRLPAAVVQALDLKEGNQIEIQVAGRNLARRFYEWEPQPGEKY